MRCVSVSVCMCVCMAVSCAAWRMPVVRYAIVPGFDDSEDDYQIMSEEDPEEDVLLNSIPDAGVQTDEDGFLYYTPPREEEVENEDPEQPDTTVPTATTVEELSEKLDKLMTQVKAQQDAMAELENANKKLTEKVDLIEQQTKTNSLIFFNVRESKRETYKTTLQKVLHVINRVMKVRLDAADISVALRVSSNLTQHRPIVVRFANFVSRMTVLGARGRLSGTNIEVVPDYSERVAQTRALLVPHLHAARSQGHHAFLLYDALVVDGVRKTLEELEAERVSTIQECLDSPPDAQVEEVEVDPDHQDREDEE